MTKHPNPGGLAARLAMYDALPPEDAVVQAFTEPGRFPAYHNSRVAMLQREMPLLYRALTRLAAQHRKDTK